MRGHDPLPPIRWWHVLGGGLLVAAYTYGAIWVFAILGFALVGPAR